MKKIFGNIFIVFLSLLSIHTFGADNYFFGQEVSQVQITDVLTEENELNKSIEKFSIYELNTSEIYNYSNSFQANIIEFNLELENSFSWNLAIELNDLRAKKTFKTRVKTDEGIITLPPSPASTYIGNLTNYKNSRVRLSIRKDVFLGMIAKEGNEFFIEPVSRYVENAPADWFVVYNVKNVIDDGKAICGAHDLVENMILPEDFESVEQENMRGSRGECLLASIAIAADGSMVSKLGNVQNVENEILDIFNIVEDRYLDPDINIGYEIATIFISSNVNLDPWAFNGDFGDYLGEFTSWGNNGGFGTSFALASIWTNKNFAGGAVGLAWVGSVCTNTRYNANQHFTPNMLRLIQVQAHEMGHNWGAGHAPDNNSPNNVYVMSPSVGSLNDQWHPQTITSITNHKNSRTCLSSGCLIAPVSNFLTDVIVSCDGTVNFTDNSFNSPTSWEWDFGDGTTSTQQNPSHTYQNSGLYTITLTTSNDFGENELLQENFIVVDIIEKPQTTDAESCEPGEVTLTASGTEELIWYDAPTGGNIVNTGNTFTTNLSETTTFYVESSNIPDPQFFSETINTFASGAYFTANDSWGLFFDIHSPLTLKSVKVFSDLSANRTIQILSGSSVIYSEQKFIPAGESRVDIDASLQAGEDYLIKVTGNTVSLYRNDAGAVYPYEINGLISITGNNTNTGTADDYYYYFYDWEVQEPGCATERSEVTAFIDECSNIENFQNADFISVYPNPANGIYNATISLNLKSNVQLEVLNTMGQRIYHQQTEAVGDYTHSIDITNHAGGIYILRILVDDMIFYRKLIKE
ncbi:MAG: PKD domain-containing protein [Chitinophagaceae bacterium]|nr:MAG: PKD domain-containing protein [Chitinophagaceae bacterium]